MWLARASIDVTRSGRLALAHLACSLGCVLAVCTPQSACAAAAHTPDLKVERQRLEDAWFTGPLLAASAATLPRGRFLVEPYVFDVIANARYDDDGERRNQRDSQHFGSLTYLLYGLTDDVTVGMIPRFGYNDVADGRNSSGVRFGDLSLQAQYRFTGAPGAPTMSLVIQHTLPTGKHDRLGERASDGMGTGAHATMVALYTQHYHWLPNGRILRTRFNVGRIFQGEADVSGRSVYGTPEGFTGRAAPGDALALNLAGEYSLSRNWVVALDLEYLRESRTRLTGRTESETIDETFGPSVRWALAPAIEYNFTSRVGVILGVRWMFAGRNTDASVTPVAAVNIVY